LRLPRWSEENYWIHLAKDEVEWWAFVGTVTNRISATELYSLRSEWLSNK